nr:MAG TPA: hypothetical protein [Caudoviricetes sp.]
MSRTRNTVLSDSCSRMENESGPVRMRQHPRGPNPLT